MSSLTLATFQVQFAAALLGNELLSDPRMATLAAHPAFTVYRNGVMKSAVDALQANYPAVNRLVGDEWMRAAACEFVRRFPPTTPMLIEYGQAFPQFLTDFEPAADLPYLAAVAALDRMWTEAHVAADAPALAGHSLVALAEKDLAATVLTVHPAARWSWSDDMPIYTLWHRNRTAIEIDAEMPWAGEGTLITRPHSTVTWLQLDRASCAFLDACQARKALVAAAQAAVDTDPEVDLQHLMQTLVAAGAFCSLNAAPYEYGDPS